MAYNSDHFNLTNWKLTVPVDGNNGHGGVALEIKNLLGYEDSRFFWDSPNGDMTFRAITDGAKTSGTHFARTELREMQGASKAAWHLSEGGTMSATLKIDETPLLKDGTPGRFIVGQIHGEDNELVRLYYDKGQLYFQNDQSGTDNKEHRFTFANAKGEQPNISVGEEFSYMIDAHGKTLTVKILADGQTYSSTSTINDVWQSDSFYFKAGVYLGVNEDGGKGAGQASFHALDYSHAAGGGMGGWGKFDGAPHSDPAPAAPASAAPVQPASPHASTAAAALTINGDGGNNNLSGNSGGDTISGGSGNDIVSGNSGNDMLFGNNGNDTLIGGLGADTLKGGDGKDTFVFADIREGGDTIADFRLGEKIDISGIVANNLHLTGTGAAALMLGGFLSVKHVDATHDAIYVDVDGAAGHGAATLLATAAVAALHPVTALDFLV